MQVAAGDRWTHDSRKKAMLAQGELAIPAPIQRVASSTPRLRALPMVARPFSALEERTTPFLRQAEPRMLQASALVERMRLRAKVVLAAKALAAERRAV